ncbi:hypothetical protein PVAP13_7NG174700 [Panicum virgatum]|uniref:Uncharacterized protein n=1 Tax=Panicum virgatum TaxID=38727 RepID=A0A8T0PUH6_PANVG|nr:hypothetical protein PVAP13_7NG174700 [Panicum virgatum]
MTIEIADPSSPFSAAAPSPATSRTSCLLLSR